MAGRLTEEGIARFGEVARAHVDDRSLPGLVALVASGDDVHVEVQGSLAAGGAPMRRDSLFRIASTTKPLTAAAALALVGEGLLVLDEPVARLLPEYAEPRVLRQPDGPLDDTVEASGPITLRQLLTFTYGFGMCVEMFMSAAPWPVVLAANELRLATLGPPAPAEQPDPDTWMAQLASLPLIAQPGERWLYNTSSSVLGVLVARAAGAPLAEVLRSRIFEPLGMHDTAFFTTEVERLATAYQPTAGGLEVWDPPEGQWSRPPAFGDGAAGLVSTVDDLLAFARMLLAGGGGLLDPQLVAEMTSDQLTGPQRESAGGFLVGRSWGYGQSVLTEGPHAGAYGWDGGLGTSWLVDPVRDLVVIVLTQRLFERAQAPQVHVDLQEAAYAALA